ncbi:MAG: sulfatase-like hydrolase/transferase [Clostridiales bacterium]|nr:sulfatase-like hydrolase/transferase [Clostridiales bacterium]
MINQPNIIFLLTDDQRFNTIGCHNNKAIHTPNIDELMKRGTYFENACIQGGTSGAVCMPSRAMLHTGRNLFHLQGSGEEIPKEHVLLGELLQKQGYETFGTGKWHNGTSSYARSFSKGDNIFFGGMDDHWNVPVHSFDKTGKYNNKSYKTLDYLKCNDKRTFISDHTHTSVHSSDLFANSACEYLESKTSNNPYFMYVSYMAPHDPRTMPQIYLDMYSVDDIEIPFNYLPEHPFDFGQRSIRDEMLENYPRGEQAIKKHIVEYYAMITHLDDTIGKIVEAVKKRGDYNNTIFILAGDNGLALGQHGLMGKQNLYEHSIRVPLLFSGSNIPKGKISKANVYLNDVFPTICELVSIATPQSVEGKSLNNAIYYDDLIRDDMYYAYKHTIRSIKVGNLKLIEYRYDKLKKVQLFNLDDDPLEMNNIAKEHKEIVKKLQKKLIAYGNESDEKKTIHGQAFWNNF